MTPVLVVAVALIGRDGDVLMQQRPFGKIHGGLWEFPGGKVDPGESPEAAAARELEEELAVRIDPGALSPVGFASGHTAGPAQGGTATPRPLVILLYACEAWEGAAQGREGQAIGWYRPDAVPGLDMPPLDYPLAAALLRHLSANSLPAK